jgi:hypothetical protein
MRLRAGPSILVLSVDGDMYTNWPKTHGRQIEDDNTDFTNACLWISSASRVFSCIKQAMVYEQCNLRTVNFVQL